MPALINYQAKLTNDADCVLTGKYQIRFSLYNDPNYGSSLWGELQEVWVDAGLCNAGLGKVTSFPPGLFDNSDLYLEIVIYSPDTDTWETLSPRQQLTSVAYAMKSGQADQAAEASYAVDAVDADTLDGHHASSFLGTSDDCGRSGVAEDLYEGATKLSDKYVAQGQPDSIATAMIRDKAVDGIKIADGAVNSVGLADNAVTSAKIQDATILKEDLGFELADRHSLDAADGSPQDAVSVDNEGQVGIGTTSPAFKLDVNGTINATEIYKNGAPLAGSNAGPVSAAYWPDFEAAAPYLLKNALWVGWDSNVRAWKYYKEADNDRGMTDPCNPTGWTVNGSTIGYFDGDLPSLPPGTHSNNRYNPKMMASRCNQDDIQVKVGSFWIDKYACRIIDVGAGYSGSTWKDDSADMTTSANYNGLAFSGQ
jgi:hypothetical protein